ncbi:diaminobutyrate--2-oxoglutarate transaminase [Hahella sp. HN01]|uniref:diaminobutyrate--2-oxoglutarate transaminase n=1 Tax=Hahella sp. HN01 TaxID=2847262 RepID=UPI001C1EC825|nr:diaminobutyrate--2-oxoglutarate transaminase [Hahella sp. HN01]MBU6950646.1 diaminobutyrate--2-oxoglutarate transaminase [Hahella sp. HN01]
MNIFQEVESGVQSYARSFPKIFNKAKGVHLYDVDGEKHLDFLAGAGTLNYGHNNPALKEALLEYISQDGVAHGLDMHTDAKARFLTEFKERILTPRKLEYVVQFTGPTGANAVEAALKVARNVTGRHNVVAFTNGFHGVTLGSLAATGNSHHRDAAGVPLNSVTHLPYDGYLGKDVDTSKLLDKMISDNSSGLDLPAAVILETVQGEGGLNVASERWLRNVEAICRKHGILLIVDDIQAGCGRTGTFFSFEKAGIKPDIVTLSKSLSGFGLPFAVTLIKPEYDQWKPGEHNGTFRGNNHAFITAAAAIRHYWSTPDFAAEIERKSEVLRTELNKIADKHGKTLMQARGRGMMRGLNCRDGELAAAICKRAFQKGLIIETSGSESQVVKCLCPLVISEQELKEGLATLAQCVEDALVHEISKAS